MGLRDPCTRGYVGDLVDAGQLDPEKDVYIGRGDSRKGLKPSALANPWKIGEHGDRDQVLAAFTTFAQENARVRLGSRAIGGRKLWCHCKPQERCHGDVLAELHTSELKSLEEGAPEEPHPFSKDPGFCGEALAAMARVGRGEPLTALKRGAMGHVVDGSGVCSPGKWRVSDRVDVSPSFSKAMRQVLEVGVHRWSIAVGSEPRQLLFALAAGKHAELDVPAALVGELVGSCRPRQA